MPHVRTYKVMRVATVSQLHTIEQAYWLAQWCAGLHAGALIYMCVCVKITHTLIIMYKSTNYRQASIIIISLPGSLSN